MRVLVTGATGFVGRALIRQLPRLEGWALIPAVRRSAGLPNETVVGAIDAVTNWSSALAGCETVVHLAARVHVMHDTAPDPLAAFRAVNVEGTVNLARQAVRAGVKRFVYVSSIKVNGECSAPGIPFRVDDMPAPSDPYAVSKLEAERALMTLANSSAMEVVIVRPPLVYGPGVKGNFATLISWLERGIPLPLSKIRNRRSLIAVDNLVDFIALCADRARSPAAANRVFLIADGADVSTPELIRSVAQAHGLRARLFPAPLWLLRLSAGALGKTSSLDRLVGDLAVDISDAVTSLGWYPPISLDEQLRLH